MLDDEPKRVELHAWQRSPLDFRSNQVSAANTAASTAAAVMFSATDLPQNDEVTQRRMLPRMGFFQSRQYHHERSLLAAVTGMASSC